MTSDMPSCADRAATESQPPAVGMGRVIARMAIQITQSGQRNVSQP